MPTDPKLIAFLSSRPNCVCCKWALEDLEKNGEPTDHPKFQNLSFPIYPKAAKFVHLRLEGVVFSGEDLSSVTIPEPDHTPAPESAGGERFF